MPLQAFVLDLVGLLVEVLALIDCESVLCEGHMLGSVRVAMPSGQCYSADLELEEEECPESSKSGHPSPHW